MNPGVEHLLILVCVLVFLLLYLAFEVLIFRASCRLARAPLPTAGRTLGIVLAILLSVSAVEGLVSYAIVEAYLAGGYPIWEAGLVAFIVGLPIHMLVATAVHAKMMGMSYADGFAVWFVDKAIKLGLFMVGAAALALLVL